MESSFRIGERLVEPLQNCRVRGDTRVKPDPKVTQVLPYLAEPPNRVALEEKIIEKVWEVTFVAAEVLTNAIFELSARPRATSLEWCALDELETDWRLHGDLRVTQLLALEPGTRNEPPPGLLGLRVQF